MRAIHRRRTGGASRRPPTPQPSAAQYQEQIQDIDRQIAKASSDQLDVLYARRYELTAELNLANTQRDVLGDYAKFTISTEGGDNASLSQKIEQLALCSGYPGGDNHERRQRPGTSPPSARAFQVENAGIFALIGEMTRLSGRMSEIQHLADDASNLRGMVDRFRQPMRDETVTTMHRSNATTATSRPTDEDPIAMESRGVQIDQMTDRFKQLSSASIPLAKQSLVFDASRDNLLEWRAVLDRQYSSAMRTLLWRLAAIVGTVIVVVIVSELRCRATFRYIQDLRRQRQLMVVRRIVIGLIVLIIIIGNVVSEFGSLATFAGLITAGVAVALQTVILSGVAYFFFIGRFGVRVGDRVTINNITGDVIEIGLFRIYLMELSGARSGLSPTGRVVVFSNSVLFQPSAFYKQLPGSDYVWHEVAMTLSPDCDINVTETRLLNAVNTVFAKYQPEVEAQHAQISRSLHVNMGTTKPESRMRFVDAGVEFIGRYPVDLHDAAKIDDNITRELLSAINQEPKLKLSAGGMPKIQSA